MLDKLKTMADTAVLERQNKNPEPGPDSEAETKPGDDSFKLKFVDKMSSVKGNLKDLSIFDKLKDFSSNAVNIVTELDEHLQNTNSFYEVADFRVNANVGLRAGMSVDIHLVKSQTAKIISQDRTKMLLVKNPRTGKEFKVDRVLLANKKQAKVRDPESGEILLIDTKSGEIVVPINSENTSAVEERKEPQTGQADQTQLPATMNLQSEEKYLIVVNPRTGKQLKIPRNKLAGMEQAKIKDPETGEVLLFQTETGDVIDAPSRT